MYSVTARDSELLVPRRSGDRTASTRACERLPDKLLEGRTSTVLSGAEAALTRSSGPFSGRSLGKTGTGGAANCTELALRRNARCASSAPGRCRLAFRAMAWRTSSALAETGSGVSLIDSSGIRSPSAVESTMPKTAAQFWRILRASATVRSAPSGKSSAFFFSVLAFCAHTCHRRCCRDLRNRHAAFNQASRVSNEFKQSVLDGLAFDERCVVRHELVAESCSGQRSLVWQLVAAEQGLPQLDDACHR